MNCPFCQQELKTWAKYTDGTSTVYCSKCNLVGDSKLFLELTNTKKKLDVCEECCRSWEIDYRLEFEKSTKLENQLKDTKKKLDITCERLKDIVNHDIPWCQGEEVLSEAMERYAQDTLEQINQKEEK